MTLEALNKFLFKFTFCTRLLKHTCPVIRIKQLSFKHWSKILKTKQNSYQNVQDMYLKGGPVHGNFSGCTPLHPYTLL